MLKKNYKYIFVVVVLILLIAIILVYFLYYKNHKQSVNNNQQAKITTPLTSTLKPVAPAQTPPTKSVDPLYNNNPNGLDYPIKDFKNRITKKTFGMYITPQNSPVQPERFTGYHLGVDIEYGDVSSDVPVYAISDGTITYSNWVSGYGGVLILKVNINGAPHSVLYGHLRPTSLPSVGTNFKKGQQMAVLGTAYSHETDGERRHLHFSVLSNDRIQLLGYAQTKSQLSGWIDPLTLYS
jgi:murein DD-endopeptidase MepM/ murein hydrolase activator NlpD